MIAEPLPPHPVSVGGRSLDSLVRRARRTADLSQRELATRAGVSKSTIGAVEAGRTVPSLPVLSRILDAAGFHLVVVDAEEREVRPLLVWDGITDLAGRRFPAHLDTIVDPAFGEWWADGFGLARPPETFRRDRELRDYHRRLSRWQVRVAQYRDAAQPRRPRLMGRTR